MNEIGKFIFQETTIKGLFEIDPKVHYDERGYFMETYNEKEFVENGIDFKFVQDNESNSKMGVIRGLHFQKNNPQAKLIRVIQGEIFDVGVDLRKNSQTFGKWHGVNLSSQNKKQFFIPESFAHGFLVLSQTATICYKCTSFYDSTDEGGILWDDESLNIKWPISKGMEILLSDKDKAYTKFRQEDYFI